MNPCFNNRINRSKLRMLFPKGGKKACAAFYVFYCVRFSPSVLPCLPKQKRNICVSSPKATALWRRRKSCGCEMPCSVPSRLPRTLCPQRWVPLPVPPGASPHARFPFASGSPRTNRLPQRFISKSETPGDGTGGAFYIPNCLR